MAEHQLSNGAARIDFQTEPARYGLETRRRWRDRTLSLDVDEDAGLFEATAQAQFYDLGVDMIATRSSACVSSIPRSTVLLRPRNRVFAPAPTSDAAGASAPPQVNFCRFTSDPQRHRG